MPGKTNRKLIALAGLALVILAAAAVTLFGPVGIWDYYRPITFTDVAAERATLIDGIESYQSVDEFKAYLAKKNYTWKERSAGSSTTGNRPPSNITTISVDGYSSDGFPGRLSAIFFNNRLMSTIFYPSEPDRYLEYISLEHGITFDSKNHAEIPPYTIVSHSVDHTGKRFVIWEDERLRKENEIWVLRYS